MKATELNREQLICLKQQYIVDWYDTLPWRESPSMKELAEADKTIPDDLVFDYFEGIDFVPEDFPEFQENN